MYKMEFKFEDIPYDIIGKICSDQMLLYISKDLHQRCTKESVYQSRYRDYILERFFRNMDSDLISLIKDYKTALKYNGYLLQYVPEDQRTMELCEIACKKHGYLLQYVPEDQRTMELYEIACRNNGMR